VLEFYANFGSMGIIFGFFMLGILVGYCDRMASKHLTLPAPDWDFYLWFGAGFALVNTIGFLAEIIGAYWVFTMSVLFLKMVRSKSVRRVQ
jgi:hypothetical protein